MFQADNDTVITVAPKDPKSKWIALDTDNNILAEGEDPNQVIENAKKTGVEFTIMYVPIKGNTYIF